MKTRRLKDVAWHERERAELERLSGEPLSAAEHAAEFAAWLNANGRWMGSPVNVELQRLLRDLVDLMVSFSEGKLQKKWRAASSTSDLRDFVVQHGRLQHLVRIILKKFSLEYTVIQWLWETPQWGFQSEKSDRNVDAPTYMGLIARMSANGEFSKFRKCKLPSCGKYFFAAPRHKRYCQRACQEAHYNGSEDRRRKNREAALEHYHQHDSAEARRLQQEGARYGLSSRIPKSELKKIIRGLRRKR